MIVPIIKKREFEKVIKEYKETLMTTSYKVYMVILAERIREDSERKKTILHNQTGIRKETRTINNTYKYTC